MLVNFAAGGPTDIEGRLFAKHIGRHIDGQPSIVVQNMDGAGGLVGTSYLGEIAPKDGTVMGYLTGAAWRYASDPDKLPRRLSQLRVRRLSARHRRSIYVRTDVDAGHARRRPTSSRRRAWSPAVSRPTIPRTC